MKKKLSANYIESENFEILRILSNFYDIIYESFDSAISSFFNPPEHSAKNTLPYDMFRYFDENNETISTFFSRLKFSHNEKSLFYDFLHQVVGYKLIFVSQKYRSRFTNLRVTTYPNLTIEEILQEKISQFCMLFKQSFESNVQTPIDSNVPIYKDSNLNKIFIFAFLTNIFDFIDKQTVFLSQKQYNNFFKYEKKIISELKFLNNFLKKNNSSNEKLEFLNHIRDIFNVYYKVEEFKLKSCTFMYRNQKLPPDIFNPFFSFLNTYCKSFTNSDDFTNESFLNVLKLSYPKSFYGNFFSEFFTMPSSNSFFDACYGNVCDSSLHLKHVRTKRCEYVEQVPSRLSHLIFKSSAFFNLLEKSFDNVYYIFTNNPNQITNTTKSFFSIYNNELIKFENKFKSPELNLLLFVNQKYCLKKLYEYVFLNSRNELLSFIHTRKNNFYTNNTQAIKAELNIFNTLLKNDTLKNKFNYFKNRDLFNGDINKLESLYCHLNYVLDPISYIDKLKGLCLLEPIDEKTPLDDFYPTELFKLKKYLNGIKSPKEIKKKYLKMYLENSILHKQLSKESFFGDIPSLALIYLCNNPIKPLFIFNSDNLNHNNLYSIANIVDSEPICIGFSNKGDNIQTFFRVTSCISWC